MASGNLWCHVKDFEVNHQLWVRERVWASSVAYFFFFLKVIYLCFYCTLTPRIWKNLLSLLWEGGKSNQKSFPVQLLQLILCSIQIAEIRSFLLCIADGPFQISLYWFNYKFDSTNPLLGCHSAQVIICTLLCVAWICCTCLPPPHKHTPTRPLTLSFSSFSSSSPPHCWALFCWLLECLLCGSCSRLAWKPECL